MHNWTMNYIFDKNWNKSEAALLRAHGGKIEKLKHNLKIHLFGGISLKELTPLVMFTETICISHTFRIVFCH